MSLIEAAKQALEALEIAIGYVLECEPDAPFHTGELALANLRKAIKEAEKQEPVAWLFEHDGEYLVGHEHMRECFPTYTHPAPVPEGWKAEATRWIESVIASEELDNHVLRDLISMIAPAQGEK